MTHYETNYGGTVQHLNLISEQPIGLQVNTVSGALINGLKRDGLIAANSMILQELFFDCLREESAPGEASSWPRTRRSLAVPYGCCCRGRAQHALNRNAYVEPRRLKRQSTYNSRELTAHDSRVLNRHTWSA